jgi:hypothetical protein
MKNVLSVEVAVLSLCINQALRSLTIFLVSFYDDEMSPFHLVFLTMFFVFPSVMWS